MVVGRKARVTKYVHLAPSIWSTNNAEAFRPQTKAFISDIPYFCERYIITLSLSAKEAPPGEVIGH